MKHGSSADGGTNNEIGTREDWTGEDDAVALDFCLYI